MSSDKLPGLTMSGNLPWNDHISDKINKASKFPYLTMKSNSIAGFVRTFLILVHFAAVVLCLRCEMACSGVELTT